MLHQNEKAARAETGHNGEWCPQDCSMGTSACKLNISFRTREGCNDVRVERTGILMTSGLNKETLWTSLMTSLNGPLWTNSFFEKKDFNILSSLSLTRQSFHEASIFGMRKQEATWERTCEDGKWRERRRGGGGERNGGADTECKRSCWRFASRNHQQSV